MITVLQRIWKRCAMRKGGSYDDKRFGEIILDEHLKEILHEANESCSDALINLDSLLTTLNKIKNEYYAITGRTNMLMTKCESLLEQQVYRIFLLITSIY